MILRIPTVGVDSGPDWANNINASLSTIDLHDHSSGKGVKITPNGLNISSNLSFNSNSATTLRSVNFSSQSSTLADFASVYVVGNDLWFTNGGGVPVQITSGGSIVGASGTISGLVSPATAKYDSGTLAFSWQSNANIYATMQSGDVRLYPTAYTSPNYVALQAPAILGTTQPSYTLVMPLKPSVQSFMTLDSSGNMAAPWTVDGTTVVVGASGSVPANKIGVKDGGITTTQIAANTVANSNLATMPANTIKGNNTGSAATPIDLTTSQVVAMLGVPTSSVANMAVFNASGTWTIPAGVTKCKVIVTGGGGGGFGAGIGGNGASGGAGGTAIKIITGLTPGGTVSVTVGGGGPSGYVGGPTPSGGGTSSFGAYCSATGGLPGSAGSPTGGTGFSGTLNIIGGSGSYSVAALSGCFPFWGVVAGGSSYWGGSNAYTSAGAFGSGGGGSANYTVGTQGIVVIEY